MAQNKAIEIKLVRSHASSTEVQRANLVGLGLRRIGQVVVRLDNPSTRGMVKTVSHMVEFKKASLGATKTEEKKKFFTVVGKAAVEKKVEKAKASVKKKAVKE